MTMFSSRLLTLVLALSCGFSQAAELGVLAPVVVDGQAQSKPSPDGKPAPIVTRLRGGELFAKLQREAKDGFTASMLALDEAAQLASGIAEPHATWLYLSLEDGGYARSGFWLKTGDDERYVAEPFVDLVVDDETIADGTFEEIFAHELGHVMLRRLVPRFPLGYSRTPHSAFAITDPPTAFDEGFAIHFQGLSRAYTRNERLRREDRGFDGRPFVGTWLSNLDRAARIDGMRRNLFVHAQLPLAGESDAIAAREYSTLFDTAKYKSGDQMMASEGVVATVFYRWLVPGDASNTALAERYGRVFEALGVLGRGELPPDTPILVRLLRSYAGLHPENGGDALRLFVETTFASTIDPAVAREAEALAARGRVGDHEAFVAQLRPARENLARVVEETVRIPARLDAALSTPIWLYAELPPKTPEGKPTPLAVNLNTTEREPLAALPGVGDALAAKIVAERRAKGPYANLTNLSERVKLSGKAAAAVAELNEAAQKAGTYERR